MNSGYRQDVWSHLNTEVPFFFFRHAARHSASVRLADVSAAPYGRRRRAYAIRQALSLSHSSSRMPSRMFASARA